MISDVFDGADPDVTQGRREMSTGKAVISCVCPYSLDELVQENHGSPTGPVGDRFLGHRYV